MLLICFRKTCFYSVCGEPSLNANTSSSLFIISFVVISSFMYSLYHLITSCLSFPPSPFPLISFSHSRQRKKGTHSPAHQVQQDPDTPGCIRTKCILSLYSQTSQPTSRKGSKGREQSSKRDSPQFTP